MRLLILLTLAFCLLTGCASGVTPTPEEPIRTSPPPNLTAPPRQLPQPETGHMRALEANHLQVAKAYHLLASQICQLQAYLQINHPECRAFESKSGKTD